MNKKNLIVDAKVNRRPPMMINEKGEVIFAPPPAHCEKKGHNSHVTHKPTPLMLCNEISKMFSGIMREGTKDECPLQGSYRDIMFHLAREDGKTQLELANLAHITPPSASVALQKLEDEGYIERKSDDADKRKTRVYLTEKGKRIDEKAKSVIHELDNIAAKGFTEQEINALCVLLYRMRENIAND